MGPALVLALLPWLAHWLVWGWPTRRTYMGGALALLVVSTPVGIWASYDPALSWPLLWDPCFGRVSLFFAFINTQVSPHWLTTGLIGVAVLFAFYFVGQYDHFHYLEESGWLADLGRLTGSILPSFVFFTPHPNAAASFLESSLLLSLVLVWQARGNKKLIWGGAAALIAYGLLISASRGAWVGLVIAVSLWAIPLIPHRNLRWIISGIVVIAVLAGIYGITQIILSESPPSFLSSTVDTGVSRLTLYRNSLYLLGDYPFTGIGLGDTFGMVYSRYQLLIHVPYLTYSHNLFLSVGLGLGLLGLAALIWLLISFYLFVIRVEQVGLSTRYAHLFRSAWLGATITFIHGLTDAPQFAGSGWTMPMLFGILGLAVAIGRLAFEGEEEAGILSLPHHRQVVWLVGGLIVAVLLVCVLVFGDLYWGRGMGIWDPSARLKPNFRPICLIQPVRLWLKPQLMTLPMPSVLILFNP
ncbi:MAG: O-antigen ligase family protein [Anaerolineales bacterium]|nr:O-antigen ligase family protein [Anaerolineales bacterium]